MPPPPFPMTLARRSAVAAATSVASSTTTSTTDDTPNSAVVQNTQDSHGSGSGGNPKGTLSSSSQTTTTKYHPSIFRCTCRGRLTLDSTTTHHHAGVCHGIQSQLEHIDHWRTTTEEEALQWFQAKAAWNEGSATPPAGPGGAPAAASSGDAPGGGNTAAHALQLAHISNVLVYPSQLQQPQSPSNNNNNNKKKKQNTKLVSFAKNPATPTKEQWGCYGSTEIDLLVLRPQHSKEERIVAVSPYCAPGMTIRDVTLPDAQGKERTSTIRLGILEILYQSTMDDDEDEELEEEEDDQVDAVTTHTATTTPTTQEDTSSSSEPTKEEENGSPQTKKKKKRKQRVAPEDDAEPTKSFSTKFWKCSQNVWKHMQLNANLLYQATQEDFMSRTVEASHKIVHEFPKTRDRTLDLMRKVIFWDWDPPSGDEPPTGGGPPPIV